MSSAASVRRALRPTFVKKIARGIKRRIIGNRHIETFYSLHRRTKDSFGFLPRGPIKKAAIYKILSKLAYEVKVADETCSCLIAWDDATFSDHGFFGGRQAINYRCMDISKEYVEARFLEAFGYALGVNPRTYKGLAVYKSNMNGLHVGAVVQCPTNEVNEGFVYERLVDSSVNATTFEELRIPVIGTEIPLIYVKHNPIAHRLENWMITCALADEPLQIITRDERRNILAFAELIGMDYGELDVLRDADGRIYIIDANKTPFGPPVVLPELKQIKAVNLMAEPFEALIGRFGGA